MAMIETTLQREYEAAIAGAGVVRLRDWSTVRVAGADRASFLHNMCTNDVKRLAVGEGCEAFFTDVKGKTLAHGFLLAGNDAIEIMMVPGTAAGLIAQLDRYVIREAVTLSDESQQRTWTLLFGKHAEDVVAQVVGSSTPDLAVAWAHREVEIGGMAVEVVRCELPWMGGFLIGCTANGAAAVEERIVVAGAVSGGEELWQTMRVESNWPLWGVDFDATNLPQEISRDAQAVSFRKGCYLGQETVARIDALGHVNKQLAQIFFEGNAVPPADSELFQGEQPVGRVTSSCWSPRFGKPAAIAMVKRGANGPGTAIHWTGGSGAVANF
jgi:tRNA-modifying protein YgfZ